MKKLIIILAAIMMAFGVANAGADRATYDRDVDSEGRWTDHSLLAYNSGDQLKVTNGDNVQVTVQFKKVNGDVISFFQVDAGTFLTQPIPTGTHSVCLGATNECFRADENPVPSMTTYGLIVLAALICLSGIWIYRRKRVNAVA